MEKMKMFLARDEDGMICLHFEEPPQRTIYERTVVWRNESEWGSVELPRDSHPEVTCENSPVEVELELELKK